MFQARSKKMILAVAGLAISSVAIFACSNSSTAKEKPKYTFKDGGKPGVAVVINGKEFSEEDLIGDQKMEFADALKRLYDLRIARVGALLLQAKYGEDASKAKMDVEEYVETKVLKDVKIADADVNKFAAEKNIPKEQVGQYKDKIIAYMRSMKKNDQRDALIAKLSKENKVEIYFQKPDLKMEVQLGNGPVFGDRQAKVKIVEFSDFQCPFCARGADVVNQIKKAYGKKVAIAFRHYPLPMHPQAKPASEASLCVNEIKPDKFWTYHDKLFAQQDKLDNDSLRKVAKDMGVDEAAFNKCFDSHKYADQVQADMDYGTKIGVRSTPTFFVNGRLVQGAQPFDVFKDIIDEEMAD
jgi:protein-disulfide isomerase